MAGSVLAWSLCFVLVISPSYHQRTPTSKFYPAPHIIGKENDGEEKVNDPYLVSAIAHMVTVQNGWTQDKRSIQSIVNLNVIVSQQGGAHIWGNNTKHGKIYIYVYSLQLVET